MAKHLLLQY